MLEQFLYLNSPDEIRERPNVLPPGDLIHGMSIPLANFPSYLDCGILPGSYFGSSFSNADGISCGMIPALRTLVDRYKQTSHHGPTMWMPQNPNYLRAAIVISRVDILRKFPGQVIALGGYLRNYTELYQIDRENGTVNGIPFGQRLYGERPYKDEVFIKPDSFQGITPDMWRAVITANEEDVGRILDLDEEGKLRHVSFFSLIKTW